MQKAGAMVSEGGSSSMVASTVAEAWLPSLVNLTQNTSVFNCPSQGMHTSGQPSDITWDDATWILTSSFIIFTMQSGNIYFTLNVKNT